MKQEDRGRRPPPWLKTDTRDRCLGEGCPFTETCRRYTPNEPLRGSIVWSVMGARRDDGLWECRFYHAKDKPSRARTLIPAVCCTLLLAAGCRTPYPEKGADYLEAMEGGPILFSQLETVAREGSREVFVRPASAPWAPYRLDWFDGEVWHARVFDYLEAY